MTAVLGAAAALAATNLSVIVVEASRLDSAASEIPAAVRVLDARAISASGAASAVDLVERSAPEIHVRRLGGGNPALSEVSMRGYGESGHGRTLVLVDGERLNSPDLNFPNLSRIALPAVSKIEVLGGAQSVLHGDGASAGVINVVTEPQDDTRRSYAEVRGGSWGTAGAAAGTRGGIAEEGVRYWADGSFDRADGYREHSGYDLYNLSGGLRKRWRNGTHLRVNAFYSDSQYDLPGALSYDEWQRDPRQSHALEDRFRRSAYGFGTTFNAQLDDENSVRLTGNFSNRTLDGHQAGDGWSSDNEFGIYSYRLLAEWINASELWGFENEFLAGGQYAADLLNGEQSSRCAGALSGQRPEYNRQAMDFFAHETFYATDVLSLQAGGRYSRTWSFNGLCERDRRADHLAAFEAALVYNPVEDSKIYLKGTRFYRNPFLDEVPGRYDAGYRWINTEILAPERGWGLELGTDWTLAEEFTVGGDVHANWLEDEIFYNSLSHQNENCGDRTFRRGADVHARWEREKTASLGVSASYVKATFDGGEFGRNRIPLVPELTASADGRVYLWDDCFVFGGYRLQGDMHTASDFGNEWQKLAWFGVFHVGATYAPSFAEWVRGWKLVLAVDNLLDERYCDYATYGSQFYPAAGRTFVVTLRYEW